LENKSLLYPIRLKIPLPLSEELHRLTSFFVSEYMEKHSVARRIGAPPDAALLPNIVPLSTRALKAPTNH
jgi:hypothetical protein